MSGKINAHISVDGRVLFDGELDDWQARPPEFVADMLKPGAKPQPYLKAVMLALTDAIVASQNVAITVRTKPGSWLMKVETEKS